MLTHLVNGFSLGGVYALIVLGFALVFGVLKILNVAHGAIVVSGAYAGVTALEAGYPIWIAVLVGALVGLFLGALLDFGAVRPVLMAGPVGPFLTTLGASLVLVELLRLRFSSQPHPFPRLTGWGSVEVGASQLSGDRLLTLGVSVTVVVIVDIVLTRTNGGRLVRAVASDPSVAASLGINIGVVRLVAFGLASAIGGASGVLLGGLFRVISPDQALTLGLKGLILLIVGGLGSLRGPVVAAFGLGVAEILVASFIGGAWTQATAFILLIFVLLARPRGLFGSRVEVGV